MTKNDRPGLGKSTQLLDLGLHILREEPQFHGREHALHVEGPKFSAWYPQEGFSKTLLTSSTVCLQFKTTELLVYHFTQIYPNIYIHVSIIIQQYEARTVTMKLSVTVQR